MIFGKGKQKINDETWDWSKFKTTEGFPVSENLLDWVIGQEKAMEECKLCLDEWIHKLKGLKKREWYRFWEKPESEKPLVKNQLSPAPSLFLLGDAGTGKSLMGRALAYYLSFLYKKYEIPLYDVICWKNKVISSEPNISMLPSPEGRKLVNKLKKKESRKGLLKRIGIKIGSFLLAGLGSFLLFVAFYWLLIPWFTNTFSIVHGLPLQEAFYGDFFLYCMTRTSDILPFIVGGSGLLMASVFIQFFGRIFGGNLTGKESGGGGAETTDAPKLIVDNSDGKAKFIDATGNSTQQLFGSISWTPFGTAGPPEHQRVVAGAVHRAFLGILYIDEIKNLHREEATTLLTVLEDGQLPITLRSSLGGAGGSAEMSVATEPVPCLNFLVAAGNFDSIPQIHPALMDRIQGYGKIVRMNNEMPNNVENRRKYVQFISQEIKRFDLVPFSREACIEIICEGRRKSGFRDKLTTRFRPMISVIKTSAILAINEGKQIVEKRHVKEAIEEHCKTIHRQLLEYWINSGKPFIYVDPKEKPRTGQIAGLGVRSFANDDVGEVGILKASMLKASKARVDKSEPYFNVAGAYKALGEDHRPETHLIPNVLKVALGQESHARVFGSNYDTPDGTCIRDYIHVKDVALAHILALEALNAESKIYNLGNGSGFSVKQVIEAARRVTQKEIPCIENERRKGDPPILIADATKVKSELEWEPQIKDLETIIKDAWEWHKANPFGYKQ